jgi:DNA-directed RNA polymerase specialized sigma24 family protein
MTIAGVDASPGDPHDAARSEALVVAAYEAHHAELYAFLARSTRDRSLAEGLLRETFLGLTREAGGRLGPVQVRGVLYRIAANLVIARSRSQSSALHWPVDRPRSLRGPAIAASPEGPGLPSERSTDIVRALDGLSVDARVALLLSAEGFTGDEIAAAIIRPASATRTLLCLARARVRVRRELFAAEGR